MIQDIFCCMHITFLLAVSPVFHQHNILPRPMLQWRLLHILFVICQTYFHLPKGVVRMMVGKEQDSTSFSTHFHCIEKQIMTKTVKERKWAIIKEGKYYKGRDKERVRPILTVKISGKLPPAFFLMSDYADFLSLSSRSFALIQSFHQQDLSWTHSLAEI